MFTNIGSKLKKTAKVLCWAGILLSAIYGVYMIIRGNELMQISYTRETGAGVLASGIVVLVFGPVFSWVWGLLLSVFGELADKVTGIEAGVKEICADLNMTPTAPEKAGAEDPEDPKWETVASFLEEMEKEKTAVGIWMLWRKYKLSDKYKDADEYIRRQRALEMMNGESVKIGELRKDIRSLMAERRN